MVKVGDRIRILRMKGEPQYSGKEGIVLFLDDAGRLHGTWGGCALIEDYDNYIILNSEKQCLDAGR